jgi:hypothetical protein
VWELIKPFAVISSLILGGIAALIVFGIASFNIALWLDWAACWVLWKVTGEHGYIELGWLLIWIVWPIVAFFLFLLLAIITAIVYDECRKRVKRGFPIVPSDSVESKEKI